MNQENNSDTIPVLDELHHVTSTHTTEQIQLMWSGCSPEVNDKTITITSTPTGFVTDPYFNYTIKQ